jgi:hypothetical protein
LRTPVLAGVGDLAGRFDAVHSWHSNVHEDYVWMKLCAQLYGFGAVGCGGDDGEVGLGVESLGEAVTHDLVAVGHDDAHRAR